MAVINERSNMIMVTGLARSGTTLVCECLDAHPQVMCIADAVNEFFKGFFRYAYERVEGAKKTVNYPIDNFFFSGSRAVSAFVDGTDLKHRIPDTLRTEILDRIAIRDGEYNPEIVQAIRACESMSFDTLFIEILELLYRTYGKAGTIWFGAKATWCEQLLPALARTFPNMSFINIIRDPRAVTASHYASETTRYPLLFHVRDWRKAVYYTWKLQQKQSGISGRFAWTRYEDLVSDPRQELAGIAKALGFDYDESMSRGVTKKPNTSYKDIGDASGISPRFKDKWKETLPQEVITQIDLFCATEMAALGYAPAGLPVEMGVELLTPGIIPYESLSGWCKEIVGSKESYENAWAPSNHLLECARLKWLEGAVDGHDPFVIRDFFYDELYYRFLKSGRPLSHG